MEQNTDKMGFALIALSVVAFVLLAVNGPLKSTVDGFFNGFKDWQTQTFNSINESNKQDVTHTAYSWSIDGTDRFTTTKPNLNLLINSSAQIKDGFFKDFDKVENGYGEATLKGTNTWVARQLWDGFSIKPRDYKPGDVYTMSMDVMFTSWNLPAGTTMGEFWISQRYNGGSWNRITGVDLPSDPSKMLNQWMRITNTVTVPPYDDPSVATASNLVAVFHGPNEGSFTVRVRNPKQEPGSTATPWMPSASEVKPSDQPKYIGTYTDKNDSASQDPTKYTWKVNPDYQA